MTVAVHSRWGAVRFARWRPLATGRGVCAPLPSAPSGEACSGARTESEITDLLEHFVIKEASALEYTVF